MEQNGIASFDYFDRSIIVYLRKLKIIKNNSLKIFVQKELTILKIRCYVVDLSMFL